jgi:hypothetical protein
MAGGWIAMHGDCQRGLYTADATGLEVGTLCLSKTVPYVTMYIQGICDGRHRLLERLANRVPCPFFVLGFALDGRDKFELCETSSSLSVVSNIGCTSDCMPGVISQYMSCTRIQPTIQLRLRCRRNHFQDQMPKRNCRHLPNRQPRSSSPTRGQLRHMI